MAANTPSIPSLPPLRWLDIAGDASVDDEGTLTMVAGRQTDWFNPPRDPSSPAALSNAPALVFSPPSSSDWQLSARVSVQHQFLFDAGTIFVHRGKDDWCKLCFELSPEKRSLVVSVVTRGVSDDANGAAIEDDSVFLRVSKYGSAGVMAFHYSTDGGKYWLLHRAFCLGRGSSDDEDRGGGDSLSVGFLSQAPTGESCTAKFSDIQFSPTTLRDLRDGS